jgi:hypothetical protein
LQHRLAGAGSGGCDSEKRVWPTASPTLIPILKRNGEVLRNDAAPNLIQQLMLRIAFLAVDIEIAGHVPPWQIERMQG